MVGRSGTGAQAPRARAKVGPGDWRCADPLKRWRRPVQRARYGLVLTGVRCDRPPLPSATCEPLMKAVHDAPANSRGVNNRPRTVGPESCVPSTTLIAVTRTCVHRARSVVDASVCNECAHFDGARRNSLGLSVYALACCDRLCKNASSSTLSVPCLELTKDGSQPCRSVRYQAFARRFLAVPHVAVGACSLCRGIGQLSSQGPMYEVGPARMQGWPSLLSRVVGPCLWARRPSALLRPPAVQAARPPPRVSQQGRDGRALGSPERRK